jgi:hypothetical protein
VKTFNLTFRRVMGGSIGSLTAKRVVGAAYERAV